MHIRSSKWLITASLILLFSSGCKKWEDHITITDPNITKTVFQQISENPDLSKFTQYVISTGYDKVLNSSKTYTVFAPTNTAMATVGVDITGDTAKLNKFISNHIANQVYNTLNISGTIRVKMLNGKYLNMFGKTMEDANITKADILASNGVVQILDKALPYLPNIWEALLTNTTIPAKQKAYLLSLYTNVFDATNAVQTGVNPVTGVPIYQAGTDSVATNQFWLNVHDLRNESNQYTLFVLSDAAWDAEITKLKPYFATSTVDSTTKLCSWEVVKDLAVAGVYTPSGTTADSIFSKFNTKMPIEKASIAQTIKTSNGTIYIMNKVDNLIKYKIKPFYVEAENYRYTSIDRRGNTYFRDRFNPITNKDFTDVLVTGHGVSGYFMNYQIKNVSSVKYRAYWVALNDFQTTTFSQKLGIGSAASTILPLTVVSPNIYTEVLLGEFTFTNYQSFLDLFLVANGTTQISCDYFRLEPVVP